MTPRQNPVYVALAGELDQRRIKFDLVLGSRHHRLLFVHANQPQQVIFSATPSDHRARLKARAFLRRLLRATPELTGKK